MNFVRTVAIAIALAVAVAVFAFRYKDPEKRAIDAEARKAAPGQIVQLPDGATYYEQAGPDTGRAVVLAAGFSVPSYIWDSLYQRLGAAGFRVIRYDYYGRGWSDRPRIDYGPDLFVRQLDGLLDSLKITQPIDLAGLSFGGTVVTAYTEAHPARVHSLIYVDPVFNAGRQLPPKERSELRWSYEMVLRGGAAAMADGQVDDFLHPDQHPDWPGKYRVQQQFRGTRESLRRTRAGIAVAKAQAPVLAELGKDPRPVLVVWGREDDAAPFASSADLLAAMPHAAFVPVDSARHLPHLEQPALVADTVIGFLRAH